MEQIFALKGNLIDAPKSDRLRIVEHGYVICKNGKVAGLYNELPERYLNIPVKDYKDRLILPGFTDLHIHAPQYGYVGLGMDMELLDWLEQHAFPEESHYKDLEYAKEAYSIFTEDLLHSVTTRANIFATIHTDATLLLMDLLEKAGMSAYVGKVNMNRNSPEYYCEDNTKISISETKRFLKESKARFSNVKPILTPRFIPSCSDDLMEELGMIQKEENVLVQSHLSENRSEIAWVKKLCPWSENYADAYKRPGMLPGNGKSVMAHCVHCTKEEQELLKEQEVFIAHCPQCNINVMSGFAPIRAYMEKGLRIGLGSDLAGGSSISILRAMTDAIAVSKIQSYLQDGKVEPLTLRETFYMATKGGGAYFGKVGSFEDGYEFDAVVFDDTTIRTAKEISLEERLERLAYLSDNRNIEAKYISGRKVL